jgi:hypothetical protein
MAMMCVAVIVVVVVLPYTMSMVACAWRERRRSYGHRRAAQLRMGRSRQPGLSVLDEKDCAAMLIGLVVVCLTLIW